MKNTKLLFVLLLAVSILFSCRKDSITTEIDINPPTPDVNIETTFNGFVTGLNGEPIIDATVKVSNQMTQTNEFGFFELTGLVNEKFAVLSFEKPGYFDQHKTLIPSKTAKNRTRIQLVERTISGSFSANTGGPVSIGQESRVIFQANSIVDENGNAYNGLVNVYTFFIDPTDENINQIMPGNLMALNTENELNILQSFGMVNVELEGQNGQALNINQSATLQVAVPSSLSGDAPEEIPLWFFDENTGLWVEEGSASLENGKYIGTVEHFTFWNCDIPNGVTFINGQIFDARGVAFSRVRITDLSTGASYTEWTDSEGFFSGGVPMNVDLLLEVIGFCGNEVLFSTNIGPFSEETANLGTFSIANNPRLSQISGTLVGCNQVPITEGQVYFKLPNQSFVQQALTDEAGNFSAFIPTCEGEEIEIRGMNLLDNLVSQTLSILPTGTDLDVGLLEVCTDVSASLGSVVINVEGEEKIFDNCTVKINNNNGDTISYLFNYYELLPPNNDTMLYTILVSERNNDLNNPDWSVSPTFYQPPSSAEDELYYTYTLYYQEGVGNITLNQAANGTGDLMQLSFENITINRRINDPNGPNILTTFTGSSIVLTGVLQ